MTKFSSAPASDDPEQKERTELNPETQASRVGATVLGISKLETIAPKTVEVLDMQKASIEEVEAKLNEELASGEIVLHGSGGGETKIIEEFDPARSNLANKRPSIYATDDPEVAIFNAVLDKLSPRVVAIRMLDGGSGASSGMNIREDGRMKFEIPKNIADAIRRALELGEESKEWKSLFRDGVVYALPKDKFSQNSARADGVKDSTDHEWNTQQKVRPEFAVTISAELIKDVLRFDGENANVEIIPVDAAEVQAGFKRGMEATIPDDLEEFSADELIEIATGSGGSDERLEFARLLKEKIGSGKRPRNEFVELAANFYEERIKEQAKV